jgi:hypothetical protein
LWWPGENNRSERTVGLPEPVVAVLRDQHTGETLRLGDCVHVGCLSYRLAGMNISQVVVG